MPSLVTTSFSRPGHLQQRRVERAAAEVVDQDVLALGGDGRAVPVGIFEARGGRLVEQRDDFEARLPAKASSVRKRWALEALAGTLIAASMRFAGRQAGVRAMVKVAFQLGQEAREQFGQPVAAPGQGPPRSGARRR